MRSVKSIQKITKTMKMISNARLREAMQRMEKARPFVDGANKIQSTLQTAPTSKTLIIAVGTDRGLCGSVNTFITKAVRVMLQTLPADANAKIVCIGDKPAGQIARENPSRILWTSGEIAKRSPNFEVAAFLAEKVMDALSETQAENVTLLYTKFISAISFKTHQTDITPYPLLAKNPDMVKDYEFEDDDRLPHMRDVMEFQMATTLWGAIVENVASELSARAAAMDSANRNAGDMLKRLNLLYNRMRQAKITTELIEIISGAEVLGKET
jgi:F-type H+-transporting ATPase subunit gamma